MPLSGRCRRYYSGGPTYLALPEQVVVCRPRHRLRQSSDSTCSDRQSRTGPKCSASLRSSRVSAKPAQPTLDWKTRGRCKDPMYDAIIVGARCAGAPTAMLLARKGYRVLLVDRASFPSDTPKGHFIQPFGIT